MNEHMRTWTCVHIKMKNQEIVTKHIKEKIGHHIIHELQMQRIFDADQFDQIQWKG